MYSARVLADSTHNGSRLITVEATFPRFILAEINTHRVLSRNSASSRAIPPEIQIQKVRDNMFLPEAFHARTKGMGQGVELADQNAMRKVWIDAGHMAILQAEKLIGHNVSKAHVNRLLEPYLWHTAIISSTKWDNFFSLRAPRGDEVDYDFPAQPEFQRIAILMRQVMRMSEPEELWVAKKKLWHLPLITPGEEAPESLGIAEDPKAKLLFYWPFVSAGRCARVSFETQGKYENPATSYDRAERLGENGHLSPFEHVARPADTPGEGRGNFGPHWVQLRQEIPHEDNRVGALEGRPPWEEA